MAALVLDGSADLEASFGERKKYLVLINFATTVLPPILEHERWGDMLKAEREYKDLGESLLQFLGRSMRDANGWSVEEREQYRTLKKILLTIRLRQKLLSDREVLDDSLGNVDGPTLSDMKVVCEIFEHTARSMDASGVTPLTTCPSEFPKFIDKLQAPMLELDADIRSASLFVDESVIDLEDSMLLATLCQGTTEDDAGRETSLPESIKHPLAAGGQRLHGYCLKPSPKLLTGETYISITVKKAGEKTCASFIDPFVTVNVFDIHGNLLCDEQYTHVGKLEQPAGFTKSAQQIGFHNAKVHIPLTLQQMNQKNAAIFFEFKHFKPKKRYNSVRCWSFLEMDELCDGGVLLEWYKKPMDPVRKRIKLHTIKKLFLNLEIELKRVRE